MFQRLDQVVFGVPGAWARVRGSLCDSVRSIATVGSVATKCTCIRDVMYKDDPRWAVSDEYITLFPPERGWWPQYLWERYEQQTHRVTESVRACNDDASETKPCDVEMTP